MEARAPKERGGGMIRENTYVYFIQPVNGGNIKIGFSKFPFRRLEQLMDWSPERLVLLAFAPGGYDEEMRIHLMFKEHWSHKEWFRPAPEVLSMVGWVKMTCKIPVHTLPASAPYSAFPHRVQQGKRTELQRANMSEAQKTRWAAIKEKRAAGAT